MKVFFLLMIASATATSGLTSWSPTVSFLVTAPQRYSLSIGVSGSNWGSLFGSDSGILFRVEPGISGIKLHVGRRGTFSFLMLPTASVETTVAFLHTWNDPWNGLLADQTYAGLEARYKIIPVVVSAGYYRHIAGSDTEKEWITSIGAGVGF